VIADATPSSDLIIISAGDSGYFPLLADAVMSVRALDPAVPIGVLDLGLRPEERERLTAMAARVVKPGWDVAFPGRDRAPDYLKAEFSRPFLPKHFPGHEMYFWLDADAWLQDWRAVELYCAAAAKGRLAIAVEIDRAYKRHYKRPKFLGLTLPWKSYRRAFGWRVADRLGRNPFANAGIFALRADAPHWEAWARTLDRVLQRTHFAPAAQTALNYVVYAERLPVDFLPCYCNWMPGDAAPVFDAARGLFVEPYTPHEVIGVMHLAGADQKNKIFRLDCLGGGTVETSLRFSESRALCGRAASAGCGASAPSGDGDGSTPRCRSPSAPVPTR
jgi:hypothetical protein